MDFVVVNSADEYSKIEQRTRLSWTAVINALQHIPLANEGERHFHLRRDFARFIGANSASAKIAVGEFLAKTVIKVFREPGNAELIQDLLRPVIDVVFAALLGANVPSFDSTHPSVSQIFDRFLSLNRRKAAQREVSQLSETFAGVATELTTSAEHATALVVLAYDSLLGSLGTSLAAILDEGAGSRLCDINYPDCLPRTGVPYVERVATKDCSFDGSNVLSGDRLRLFLDACPVTGDIGDGSLFFGKGRHLCLGQDLSQWLWRALVDELARIPLKVRVTETRLRSHDFAFHMYDRIEVAIDG